MQIAEYRYEYMRTYGMLHMPIVTKAKALQTTDTRFPRTHSRSCLRLGLGTLTENVSTTDLTFAVSI